MFESLQKFFHGVRAGANVADAVLMPQNVAAVDSAVQRLLSSSLAAEIEKKHAADMDAMRQHHVDDIAKIDDAWARDVPALDAEMAEARAALEMARVALRQSEIRCSAAYISRNKRAGELTGARDRLVAALMEIASGEIDDFVSILCDEMEHARRGLSTVPVGSETDKFSMQKRMTFTTNGPAIDEFLRAAAEAISTAEALKFEPSHIKVREGLSALAGALPNWRSAPLATFERPAPKFLPIEKRISHYS